MSLQDVLRDGQTHPMTKILIEDDYFHLESNQSFLVQIGAPAKDKLKGGDFYCPFNIKLNDGFFASRVFGINPIQALELSFLGIKHIIDMKP